MRNYRKSLHISSQFLQFCTTHRQFSTILSSIFKEPISKSSEIPNTIRPKTPNFSISMSKNHQNSNFLPQSYVTDVLLSIKSQPLCAFEFFKWAEKNPFFGNNLETFCIMFHILMESNRNKQFQRSLWKKLFKSLKFSDMNTVMKCLINTAEKYGFTLDSKVYNVFMNGFLYAYRYHDAVECFNWMFENPKEIDFKELFCHGVMVQLFKRKQFKKIEELYDKMVLRGCCVTPKMLCLVMKACMEQGKLNEAEEVFRKAKERRVELSDKPYNIAVQIVCQRYSSSDAAYELFVEMMAKGMLPCAKALALVSEACVRDGKMKEASVVRDVMISSKR